jgi:L-ascorbate metabolism protein UlaG (beta-lactamase superfamily)
MQLRLIRHATLLVEMAAQRLLIDPMLDAAGARDAIAATPQPRRNPLVELPVRPEDVVRDVDAVLVTHLHADHLDDTAIRLLRGRDVPVLGQPEDAAALRGHGFARVAPVGAAGAELAGGIRVARTGGRHGTGELADRLGPVSGFVLWAPDEPMLYIAGDTVWCPAVEQALSEHDPDVIVVNAGGARFLEGDPVTMSPSDVMATAAAAPRARVVAVHMEAINHCVVTRDELRAVTGDRVAIPADGATV